MNRVSSIFCVHLCSTGDQNTLGVLFGTFSRLFEARCPRVEMTRFVTFTGTVPVKTGLMTESEKIAQAVAIRGAREW
jgi:hypothetical protein